MDRGVKTGFGISGALIPFLLVFAGAPVIILTGFGLFVVFRDGYGLYFTGILALSTGLGLITMLLLKKFTKQPSAPANDDEIVKASDYWGDFDNRVWDELRRHIVFLLEEDGRWSVLRDHAIRVVELAAEKYHGRNSRGALAFSAPELLKMIEEVSRRYRRTLKTNVPFVEKVNLSTLKIFYDHREKARLAEKAWNVYRSYRILSPAGLIAEARRLVLGKMYHSVRTGVEHKMKRALLQEVAAVAIDLYSGRFRVDADETDYGRTAREDREALAPPPGPIRICVIGQVSAGKSAVINALTGSMAAGVGMLPSTKQISVHQCSVAGMDMVHLVDLPGLDGRDQNERQILREVTSADIVLWVVKANQSARRCDIAFLEKLDAFYTDEKNRSRKRPVMIGVLNQVDRLKPLSEWSPPYDTDNPDSPKAQIIRDALEYNRNTLKLDSWIAVSVCPDKSHFNLGRLREHLASQYEAAVRAQFNRRRMYPANTPDLADQCKRMIAAGRSLFGIHMKQ